MDSPKTPISDPSTLFLNEIEILLAQSRLVELYVKQSQATATYEAARTHERHQAELAGLRSALAEKEQSIAANQSALGAREQHLRQQVQDLEIDLGECQRRLEDRDTEFTSLESEASDLRGRIGQLEAARAQAQTLARQSASGRQELEAEMASLRKGLEENQQGFQKQQLASRKIHDDLQTENAQLRGQLSERLAWSHNAESGLQAARREIDDLHQRVAELQTSRQEAQTSAARELEETRTRLGTELDRLQTILAEREHALEENQRVMVEIERRVKTEILTLRSQLDQKQELIEFRDEELRAAQTQAAALQQRVAEVEAAQQLAIVNADEIEGVRRSYENQLEALQQEVAMRERALTERQEAVSAVELALHGKIQSLQQELARSRNLIEERESAVQSSRAQTEALRERIGQQESAAAADLRARQLAEETRRGLEAENSHLHATLAQKEFALEEQEKILISLEQRSSGEINELRRQLEQQRAVADGGGAELARLRSEIAALAEQKTELENARHALERSRQQDELTRKDLEARLQAQEEELRAVQTNAQELMQVALREQEIQFKSLEKQTSSDIVRLRNQLQEQEIAAEKGHFELAQLRAEIVGLLEQNAQSQHSRDELNQKLQQAAGLCQQLESRLKAKEDELGSAQARASEQLAAALKEQETHFNAMAEARRHEANELRSQLDYQRNSGERVHEELVHLRSENAGLQEQKAQAEHFRREFEQNWHQANRLCRELETELQAKDAERQAAQSGANTLKTQLDAKISDLQLHLAEKQLLVESRATEIKNLKVQVGRLSEQLTQRESASAESQARFQKEAELGRVEHQAALTALRDEYQIKQRVQENDLAEERQRAANLHHQISEFERRHTEAETQLKDRHQEFEVVSVEAAALRSRLNELETQRHAELSSAEQEKDQIRIKFDAELAAARHELQQKAWALAQHQATLENLALTHKNQIQKLEDKIAEQQNSIANRNLDIEKSQSQARLLERRVEELITELQQAELTSINRAVQIKEEYGLRIADLDRQVAQKTSELLERGASRSELEQTLRQEIDRLIREAQEKNQILQDRNDELVRVKSETDALLERFSQMDSSASEAEAAFTAESERMRIEFQAQLALLQAELSQKEWALEEVQATGRGLEQAYRQEIGSLRRQLEDTEARTQEEKDKYLLGDGKLTDEQQERCEKYQQVMDVVIAATNPSFPVTENRRWRSQFGWKRRWKS